MQAIRWIALVVGVGCSTDASNTVEFHGEQQVLPDFTKDTGLQPSGSPVQLQLVFSAGGSLTADAVGVAGGEGAALAVSGTPGSGVFALDAHVKLAGMLHVDVGGLSYDGPIPGIENIDIAFGGKAAFDPFLLDGAKASVSAPLPETALPPIPLPGGLPGTLQITIAQGSVLDSAFTGTCAGVEGTSVQFLASTTTSGTLVLKSKIVLTVPIVGDKDFEIPTITVPIPAVTADMDLGTHEVSGGGAPPTAGSLATVDACSGKGDDGDGGGDGDGNQTCAPDSDGYDATYHPPIGLHANECGTNQLAAFETACAGATATTTTCANFQQQNLGCFQCLVTSASAPGYGAIVSYSQFSAVNVGGCAVLLDPSQLACSKTIGEYYSCVDSACSGCSEPGAERDACIQAADAGVCKDLGSSAGFCFGALPDACTSIASVTQLFCGA
ncbi:MAG: hypothetical protein ABI867_11720 [Kofleriaceae bacterium]